MTHPSAAFARELVAALAARGVSDFVVCPGSRSGPLAHALAAAAGEQRPDGAPALNVHVRIDERAAAFLALGIARGRAVAGAPAPVAIVTTSGTAVGNLLPAVMEAHHSGVPLLLLTADRPLELRGIGANQTTDQLGIFASFVRWATNSSAPERGERPGRATLLATRAVHFAMGVPERDDAVAAPGPVHLNLEFREPLGADGGDWPQIEPERVPWRDKARVALRNVALGSRELPDEERTIVIAGDGAGDIARQVAEAHGWPLFAEPTSGARSGPNAIAQYVSALGTAQGNELSQKARQVVVIGRPTLSRPVQRLIDQARALYVAAHGARWREAPKHAERVLPTVPDEWLRPAGDGPTWLDPDGRDTRWLAQWRKACAGLDAPATGWDGRVLAQELLATLTPDDVLVLGSSMPIRTVDSLAPAWPAAKAPTLLANRGLAGIDGTISTAVGVALALGRPVQLLLGDVTALHDAGGLLVGVAERRPDLRIVVANDGGGTIFGRLEHADAEPAVLRRMFTTPHGASFAGLSSAYGVRHVAVSSATELRKALAKPIVGVELIEAVLD